ncbi:MAG: hypothetical protein ING94_17715 [Rhodocyclaceae bacterium]|nr:hypothetical protein [Rhodocyclaceae bacterium]
MAEAKNTTPDPLQRLQDALPELSKKTPLMIMRAAQIVRLYRIHNRDTLPRTAVERKIMHDRLQRCADYAMSLADALSVTVHPDQYSASLRLREVASTVLPVEVAESGDLERQIMRATANADDGRVDQFAALVYRLHEAIQREAEILRPTRGRAVNVASDVLIVQLARAWREQMRRSALAEDGRFGKLCEAVGTLVGEAITSKQIARVLRKHGLNLPPNSAKKG